MPEHAILRFLLGGAVVSVFAVAGDCVKPRTFSGIFGAAPSIALGTLGLTYAERGAHDASLEGRAMIDGAVALCAYGLAAARTLRRGRRSPWIAAVLLWGVWLATAFPLSAVARP